MSGQLISYEVVFFTPSHSISGELTLSNRRLSDFLNDRRESGVIVRKTAVARLSEPGKIIEQHPTAAISKSSIVIAFEPSQKVAEMAARRLSGFVSKKTYEVFLAMEGMDVRGFVHATSDLDLQRLVATPSESFFALTQPVITLHANDRYVIKPEATVVNVHHVRYAGRVEPRPNAEAEAEDRSG